MAKRKFKTHLGIGPTHTLCGRDIEHTTGWRDRPAYGWKPLPPEMVVSDISAVTCKVCLEAAQ